MHERRVGYFDSGDSFSGTISNNNLAAGNYCIGIAANNPADPMYSLTFNTPTTAMPEPSTFVMLLGGLGIGALRRRR